MPRENPVSWLNPLHGVDVDLRSGETKTSKMMGDSAKTAAAWFTVIMSLRLLQAATGSRADETRKLTSELNARLPVLSPDPNLQDMKQEARMQGLGMLPKTAEDKSSLKAAFSDIWHLGRSSLHKWYLPVVLLSAYAGIHGGWKAGDALINKLEEKSLKKRLGSAQNSLDKVLYDEYMRSRGFGGLPKEAATGKEEAASGSEKQSVWSRLFDPARAGEQLLTLYALVAWMASHIATKKLMDKRDPQRKRTKDLTDYFESLRARQQPAGFIDLSDYPRMTPLAQRLEAMGSVPEKKMVSEDDLRDLPEKAGTPVMV